MSDWDWQMVRAPVVLLLSECALLMIDVCTVSLSPLSSTEPVPLQTNRKSTGGVSVKVTKLE